MADRLRAQQEFEQLQNRYIGVGHSDTTFKEWQINVHRDTYASIVGHEPILEQMSVALGKPKTLVRMAMIDRMVDPLRSENGEK